MKPELIILSGPVHTGKTTALMHWCKEQQVQGRVVRGILNPLEGGRKVFYDVYHKSTFPMEAGDGVDKAVISVGKYTFLIASFERARHVITKEGSEKADVFVLDEIGKLELKGEGLEPAITSFLGSMDSTTCTKIIIVIRDYLLEGAVKRYGLEEARVIGKEGLENERIRYHLRQDFGD